MTNRNFKGGMSRDQGSLLPSRIEDYVAADNPVRAIEGYVRSILDDLAFGMPSDRLASGSRPTTRLIC